LNGTAVDKLSYGEDVAQSCQIDLSDQQDGTQSYRAMFTIAEICIRCRDLSADYLALVRSTGRHRRSRSAQ
jgi:hypothetical protein